MKTTLLTALLVLTAPAFAQKTAITDIPTDQPTTIQITKGAAQDRDFDIVAGTAEISGDSVVLAKGARDSWRKACNEWKSELKDLNKENQVIAMNCNSPKCASEQNGTTCVSTGNYQLRVRIKK